MGISISVGSRKVQISDFDEKEEPNVLEERKLKFNFNLVEM